MVLRICETGGAREGQEVVGRGTAEPGEARDYESIRRAPTDDESTRRAPTEDGLYGLTEAEIKIVEGR
jgi:hypothetical protein